MANKFYIFYCVPMGAVKVFRFEIKMEALLVLNNLLKKGVKLPQDLGGTRTK